MLGKKALALKTEVMGVFLDNETQAFFLERARQLLTQGQGALAVTVNAQMLHLAQKDPSFRAFLNSAQLALPDGQGVLYAAKHLGKGSFTKCAGVDFGDKLCRILADGGYRLFLYGGKPGVAQAAAGNLLRRHPGLTVCGTCHGYGDREEAARAIREAKPDCIYVCLGCPQQEQFIARFRPLFPQALVLPLGGSVDIYAGNLRRAPKWMISLGLEWLYRLLQQPGRWKQMAFLPQFMLEVWMEKRKNHG